VIPAELYGPFGAIAALVVVLLMIVRGDLVPGHIYRSEREQRLRAERQADENARSLSELAKAATRSRPPR
jgi:hypothetical protein